MAKLLIATYFKRPKAPVSLPNGDGTFKNYFFTPIDPTNPDSEHVCEVENRDHQATLLGIKEGYYLSDAQTAVQAAASASASVGRPAAPPTPPPPPAPPKPPVDPRDSEPTVVDPVVPAGNDDVGGDEAMHAEQVKLDAESLLALQLAAFKKALPDAPREIVVAALAIENAKPEADQRATVIAQLQKALKAE